MSKRGFCSVALAACLITFALPAAAQNNERTPKPTVQDHGPVGNVEDANIDPFDPPIGRCGNPAGPCLFYGGDFLNDPNYSAPLAGGYHNSNSFPVGGTPYGSAIFVPFTVPEGETWDVSGLFTNNISTYGVLDQGTAPTSVAYWSIHQGVVSGSGGTVVDSGTSPATSTTTGRSLNGSNEYTIQVTGLSVTLTSGKYWMTVVPYCSNVADPSCLEYFLLSDVEYINTTPANAFGPPEPVDDSFVDAPVLFLNPFSPINGPHGVCSGGGCDAFSVGVLGKAKHRI